VATVAAAFSLLIVYGAFIAPETRMNLLWLSLTTLVVGLVLYGWLRRHGGVPDRATTTVSVVFADDPPGAS
jgi:hypothetical protein